MAVAFMSFPDNRDKPKSVPGHQEKPSGPQLSDPSPPVQLNLGALSVAIVWGINNVTQKLLLDMFTPFALQCLRGAVASISLLVLVLMLGRNLRAALSPSFVYLLGAGLLVGVQMLSFLYALRLTYVAEGSLLISTAPIWTSMIVAAVGIETVSSRNWLGIFVALGGAAMVILGVTSVGTGQAPQRITGDLIMIGSAFLFGLYMVLSRPLMQRHGSLTVTALTLLFSNVIVVPLGLHQLISTPWRDLTSLHWALLGFGILGGMVYGMAMWYHSIKVHGSARTAVYQYLVPLVALGTAVVFLHEHPTRWQLAGIVVTLYGIYLAHHRPPAHLPS